MAPLKRKGDLAELMVAADLVRQGFRVALPYGEDWEADLIVDRGGRLERVQVKHVTEREGVLLVRSRSHSLTNGKVRVTKRYTVADIEWLAAWDSATDTCFYIPAGELGDGMSVITLRVHPAKNNQRAGVRLADGYRVMPPLPSTAAARGRGANGNTRPLQG